MMIADFHVHSTFSDGKLPIPALVDLFGKRGFGALAITDHLCEEDTLWGHGARLLGRTLTRATFPLYAGILRSEAERARRQYGMTLIPGFEITKNSAFNGRSAHMLALGVSDFIDPSLPVPELSREVRGRGGILVAAHPVSTRKIEKQTLHLWDNRHELKAHIDAWEVASGPYLFSEVADAGLPLIACSDLHAPRQMTSWKTIVQAPRDPHAILSAIRRQDLAFRFYEEPDAADHGAWIPAGALGLSHSA